MIPLPWMSIAKYAAIVIALYALYQTIDNHWATDAGIAEGIKRQKVETAKVQYAYDKFKTDTAALGKAAQLVADKRATDEKADKEKKDANLKAARADLDRVITDLVQERRKRASGGYLPAPSAKAGDPTRAKIIRSEFERTMEYLDERGAGIAKEGDGYRIGLDSLKN